MKIFHVIGYHDRIGERNGLVIKRDARGTMVLHLLWHFKGSKQRTFPVNHFGDEALAYQMHWSMLTYAMPKTFCAKKDLPVVTGHNGSLRYMTEDLPFRDGSLASYVGKLDFRRGVFGAEQR